MVYTNNISLQGSVEHCTIGVQLLSVLTSEMNQVSEADANRSLTKHRKIASSFRDQQLFEIFRLCCTLLKSALESRKTINFEDGLQVFFKKFILFGPSKNYAICCDWKRLHALNCVHKCELFANFLSGLWFRNCSNTHWWTNAFVWRTIV